MRTLIITNVSGRPLKKPLTVEINEQETPAEEKLRLFILETFVGKRSILIPFTLRYATTMELAKHYLIHGTGSHDGFRETISWVHRFCEWLNVQPDQIVHECVDQDGFQIPKAIARMRHEIDDFFAYLCAKGLSSGTTAHFISSIKLLFYVNDVPLELPFSVRRVTNSEYRAVTREEIQKLLEKANLRDKVLISMMASGGLRPSTVVKLQYRHVKQDLERNIIPLHVQVEAAITKGKYGNYCTFLDKEAVGYLNSYLHLRKSKTESSPPETIVDESPLVRRMRCKQIRLMRPVQIQNRIHSLWVKAGLARRQVGGKRWEVAAYSLRKFFQTELASSGVDQACIDYMMGHVGNRYNDVKVRGVEYLRNVYQSSGFGLRPKTGDTKMDDLKAIIRRWGMNLEEILKPEILGETTPTSTELKSTEEHGSGSNDNERFSWRWLKPHELKDSDSNKDERFSWSWL